MKVLKREEELYLVHRLYARDETAMTLFYTNYKSTLRANIWRIVRHDEVAEDLLQETMLKFWLTFATYDAEKSRLFTWALRIAQNLAIDHVRQQGRRASLTNSLEEQAAQVALLIAPVSFRPEHLGIVQLLDLLAYHDRSLIDLLYWQGYTQAEAADELAVPLGTIKSRNRRILRLLGRVVKAD